MATPEKVHVIGVGDDGLEGLTSLARQHIEKAGLLIGADVPIASVPDTGAQRMQFSGDVDALVDCIAKNSDKSIVVLAVGDPLFYGTARYLCDHLGKDRFEVVPNVSSMQLAFARVKESWDEAYLTNLASQSLPLVLEKIRTAEKVGLFTTEATPPSAVAQALIDQQMDYFTAYVCENLGSPDERVTHGELADVAAQSFSPLNVMVLVRKPNVPDRPTERIGRRLFGNPDEVFLQSKPKRGLLTPAEVRSMALAEMDLGSGSIVWDVGAGSGSLAIEAAQIASGGRTFAIEMDPEDVQLITANAKRFGVTNLVPVQGRAPDAWGDLPDPDAVFVGGTGRAVAHLVEMAWERLRVGGRLVVNVGTVESVAAVREALQRLTDDAGVWMINVARGNYQLERMRFESLNPTFLLAAVKN